MTQDEAKTAVRIMLEDTLSQVSDDRLNAATTEAWEDGWVSTKVVDNSLVYSSSTYEYSLPSTVTTVSSIYKTTSGDTTPINISADLYEVYNGKIRFNEYANNYLSDGDSITIKGIYKLKSTDSIPSDNYALKNYVLCLIGWIILRGIGFSKILAFLRNDVSTNELLAFRQQMEQDMLKYRMQLQTEYQDN